MCDFDNSNRIWIRSKTKYLKSKSTYLSSKNLKSETLSIWKVSGHFVLLMWVINTCVIWGDSSDDNSSSSGYS